MTEVDLAWLAGLLEGEGCFSFVQPKKGYGYAYVSLNMTDEDVVRRVAQLTEVHVVNRFDWREKKYPEYKVQWRWHASHDHAVALMENLLPLMGVRRAEKIREVIAADRASAAIPRKNGQPRKPRPERRLLCPNQ